jgi:hypothetical protein
MSLREAVLFALVVVFGGTIVLLWRRRPRRALAESGARRILVPFVGQLDPTVLEAAIRIAQAEHGVLVPAYLVIVPWRFPEESPLKAEVDVAMPLLEAVEHAALREGVPVDARIEKGRSLTHALQRLWDVEDFDRVIAPATRSNGVGFTAKDLTWILERAPGDTVILRPRALHAA